MKKSEKLYVVMPAYNEEENIESVVEQWYPILKFGSKESKLVIADAGSVDKTHKILVNLKKKYPQLEIVSKSLKQHGPKVIYLYKYAIKNNADWIFQTDSDGQTNPDEFEEFWKLRNKYDVILGNRTVRGDGKSRAFVEKVVCFLLKLYFGVKVRDAKTKYGSCIPKTKALHFTSRLVMLKDEAIDAVIVHELCHIVHPNHSKDFYKLVERYIPNYKEIDRYLKKSSKYIRF